jgi:hypothetical protein
MTAERFVSSPFSSDTRVRLYKTGDLGRWRSDGTLDYLGRNDHQVKIRGFRVELGEIEACLKQQVEIRDALVVAREESGGDKGLVAYLIYNDGQTLGVEVLRLRLQGSLPSHMIPTAFVALESFPLTPNGKLDRRALPSPMPEAHAGNRYEAPQGETELFLAEIWQGLLGIDHVGRYDDVFALGAHSLLAMQAMSRIRSVVTADIPMRFIFECPTVEQLASRLETWLHDRVVSHMGEGERGLEELLRQAASMPDRGAQQLMQELTRGTRP